MISNSEEKIFFFKSLTKCSVFKRFYQLYISQQCKLCQKVKKKTNYKTFLISYVQKCAMLKLSLFRNVGRGITNFRKTYPGPTYVHYFLILSVVYTDKNYEVTDRNLL